MGYLALYRKYRPSGFEGVVGQEHIIQTLVNQISFNRLGHAYLFTGTRGTGKTSVAKIFAKAINCKSPVNGSPCGKCASCIALSDVSNIDVIEIDAASNNGVNEIRDIRENVQFPPVSCDYKVYIIDEVHMLTGAAFNALLKTLEEPPRHAVFILATTEVHKIPATILSRCMRFDFRLVDTDKICDLICQIYDKEGKKYQKEAVFAIAKAGEGSIRDALSIADIALSVSDGELKYEDVLSVLGASDGALINELVCAVFKGDSGAVLDNIDKLCGMGKSIGVLLKDVCALIRDLIVVKNCKDPNKILGLPDSIFVQLRDLASLVESDRLLRALELLSEIGSTLRYSNNPRIIFETAMLKISRVEIDFDLTSVMSRISALEKKVESGVKVVATMPEINKTVKTQEKPIVFEEVKEPISISQLSNEELKGKILSGLRRIRSEMLWNVVQNTRVGAKNDVVTIYVNETHDFDVLSRIESISKIKESLSDYNVLDVLVEQSKANIELKEIDDATEKIKRIFGDDIVIVKD